MRPCSVLWPETARGTKASRKSSIAAVELDLSRRPRSDGTGEAHPCRRAATGTACALVSELMAARTSEAALRGKKCCSRSTRSSTGTSESLPSGLELPASATKAECAEAYHLDLPAAATTSRVCKGLSLRAATAATTSRVCKGLSLRAATAATTNAICKGLSLSMPQSCFVKGSTSASTNQMLSDPGHTGPSCIPLMLPLPHHRELTSSSTACSTAQLALLHSHHLCMTPPKHATTAPQTACRIPSSGSGRLPAA